jgi:hypothetical protein
LALPLDGFAFHLEADRPPRIAFTDRIADNPATWQFAQFRPGPTFRLAVAIQRPNTAELAVSYRPFVPHVG